VLQFSHALGVVVGLAIRSDVTLPLPLPGLVALPELTLGVLCSGEIDFVKAEGNKSAAGEKQQLEGESLARLQQSVGVAIRQGIESVFSAKALMLWSERDLRKKFRCF
jgi:hypothetical protein